jgi:hypothetical protein
MSILFMEVFVRMRALIAANKDLAARVEKLKAGQRRTASIIDVLVDEIDGIVRDVKNMKALARGTPYEPTRRTTGL